MEKKNLLMGITNPKQEEIIETGEKIIEAKYGNLFQMYEKIVDDNPYKTPMMIYPSCTLYNGRRLGRL